MAGLSTDNLRRAELTVACYPHRRSALIPLCHLAQAQDGYLTEESMQDIAGLCGVSAAEVRGTASFYEMLHTAAVGRYVIAVCTNIACMLAGAYSLVSYAEERLGVRLGQTTADGMFALEDAECLAGCDQAVCVQVNHRFFGPIDEQAFDELIDDLRTGRLDETVPPHGVLCRVERTVGLEAHGPVPISTRAQGRLSTAAGTTAGTTARARTDAPPTDAPTSEPPPTDAPPSQTPTSEASGAAHEDVPGAEIAGGNAGSRDQAPGEDRS